MGDLAQVSLFLDFYYAFQLCCLILRCFGIVVQLNSLDWRKSGYEHHFHCTLGNYLVGTRKNEGGYEHLFYCIVFICRYMSLKCFGLFILQTELCRNFSRIFVFGELFNVFFDLLFAFRVTYSFRSLLYGLRAFINNVFILICFVYYLF